MRSVYIYEKNLWITSISDRLVDQLANPVSSLRHSNSFLLEWSLERELASEHFFLWVHVHVSWQMLNIHIIFRRGMCTYSLDNNINMCILFFAWLLEAGGWGYMCRLFLTSSMSMRTYFSIWSMSTRTCFSIWKMSMHTYACTCTYFPVTLAYKER